MVNLLYLAPDYDPGGWRRFTMRKHCETSAEIRRTIALTVLDALQGAVHAMASLILSYSG